MSHSHSAQVTGWNDQEDRRVRQLVRRYGCYVQAIHGDGERPPFAYTIGLFGLGHPELIAFGLDHESAGGILNWFAARVRQGNDLTPGELVEPAGSGTRFLVEEFPDPGAALYAANRFYRRPRQASVPAYQLTYDVNGAFPWEPGYPYAPSRQPRPGDYVE
ncbi:MAG: DUF4262 domain-containing protein [Micropruina sp.]|nr:DUF4262 domain-containing protein [Micropruina sp.]